MNVYNVARGWFTMQADADKRRKALGLKPADMGKVVVVNREDLAALLNALCAEPPRGEARGVSPNVVHTQDAVALRTMGKDLEAIVARAYVKPDDSMVPLFLRVDWAKRNGLPVPEE